MEISTDTLKQDINLNKSQVVLLRHAESYYNAQYKILIEEESQDPSKFLKLWQEASLRDAQISEDGLKQCEKASTFASQLKIHTVFISPLRRPLQTAYNILKDHPMFNEMKFVIVPKMREIMSTSNDIPVNIYSVIEEFSKLFPNLDTSELDKYTDPLHYFVEDLDESIKENILSRLQTKEDDCISSNAFDILIELIGKIYCLTFRWILSKTCRNQ